MRDWVERSALAGAALLVVLAGQAFARAHARPPPPVVLHAPAATPPSNPLPWSSGNAQAHALSLVDGLAAWTEADGSVRMALADDATMARDVATYAHEHATAGPVVRPGGQEACWVTTRAALRCGSLHSQPVDVAQAPGSVVTLDADSAGVVFTQFDGEIIEARGGALSTLTTLANAVDVKLDGDAAYVAALDPLRVVRVSRNGGGTKTVFERSGPRISGESSIGHLGSLLADRDALYLDTQDRRDGLNRVLRIAKSDGATTTLYEGFAHVAVTALHGETLYGLVAPARASGELDLARAAIVALPTGGGTLTRLRSTATAELPARDLAIGWGGSVAADDRYVYFTRGPVNPVGAPGDIWRLRLH